MKDRKSQCSEEDRALFRQAIGAVKRVHASSVLPAHAKQISQKRQQVYKVRPQEDAAVYGERFGCDCIDTDIGAEDILFFARSGVQHRIIKRLRKGTFPVDRRLDLHGKTALEACNYMAGILEEAMRQNWRCLEVIHGKGYSSQHNIPVLKNALNHWLRRQQKVLAFCSAPRHRGGAGALMVLIKRNSE